MRRGFFCLAARKAAVLIIFNNFLTHFSVLEPQMAKIEYTLDPKIEK
jgi:hypothetical protein